MFFSIRSFVLIILPLTLSACADTTNSDQKAGSLVGPEWTVSSFQDANGNQTLPGTVSLRLRFLEPDSIVDKPLKEFFGTFIGNGDNQFSGAYRFHANILSLRIHGTTLVGRDPGSREQEFMDALNNATLYDIHENSLRIYYFERTKAINLVTVR